jgi:nucleoside-diphosphate-sugar epimerase
MPDKPKSGRCLSSLEGGRRSQLSGFGIAPRHCRTLRRVAAVWAQGILSMMRSHVAVRGSYDWVDVRDVASGMLAATERGTTGERYLLLGRWMSIRGIAALLVEGRGQRPLLTLPTWLQTRGPF